MMQLTGLAAIALLLPLAIWAWRLLANRPLERERMRACCSGSLGVSQPRAHSPSSLTPPAGWPLPTGLGGTLGDAMLRLVRLRARLAAVVADAGSASRSRWGSRRSRRSTSRSASACRTREAAWPKTKRISTTPAIEDDEPRERGFLLGGSATRCFSTRRASAAAFGGCVERWSARVNAARRSRARLRRAHRAALARGRSRRRSSCRRTRSGARSRRPRTSTTSMTIPRGDARARRPEEEAGARQAQQRYLRDAVAQSSWRRRIRRSAYRSARIKFRATPPRSKACWSTSACAARSSTRSPGPVVTLYELEPAPGIKSSRVIGLADDIARSMSAISARVAVVRAATPSASNCRIRSARRWRCASCSPPRTTSTARTSWRSASARPSAASR